MPRRRHPFLDDDSDESGVTSPSMEQWDERSIRQRFEQLRNQPFVLSSFLHTVHERFLINQNDKTFKARTLFLYSLLERLELGKRVETALDDLTLHEMERKARQLELELKIADLEDRKRKQQELNDLRHEVEVLKLKLEKDRLKKESENLQKPPEPAKPEPQLTPEQQKAQRHAASEARLQHLKRLKQEALKIEDPDERVQKVNAIQNEIEHEREEWSKTL